MGSLYQFTLEGDQVLTYTNSVPSAKCSYAGGEYILIIKGRNFGQYAMDTTSKTVNLVDELDPSIEGTGWRGLAHDHNKLADNIDNQHFDARSFYSFETVGGGEPPDFYLHQINHDGYIVRLNLTNYGVGTVDDVRDVAFDGHGLFVLWSDGGNLSIDQYNIASKAIGPVARYTGLSKKSVALTTDGYYFYTLDTANVNQYELQPRATSVLVQTWAHGLGGAAGITFNGKDLLIIASDG